MKKVGLTGGIGSGKSVVCEIFKCLGVPVFNSDLESKTILNTSESIRKKLISSFGPEIYCSDGQINTPVFSSIIFADETMLRLANSIIHPAVAIHFHNWCNEHSQSVYVLKEAAILFESGAYKQLDLIIAVSSPENIRVERIMKRDNRKEENIRARMTNQWPDEKICGLADYVIQNTGGQLLIPQVLHIHAKIVNA